eukprot:768626-Hanusia_phi.AAC.5
MSGSSGGWGTRKEGGRMGSFGSVVAESVSKNWEGRGILSDKEGVGPLAEFENAEEEQAGRCGR